MIIAVFINGAWVSGDHLREIERIVRELREAAI